MAGETNFRPIATSFLGRKREIRRIQDRMRDKEWLMMILGPFGAGKTRLARFVANEMANEFDSGALFCDLTEARTRTDVLERVARTLDVPLLQSEDPEVTVANAIEARGRLLLVLDNLEQIIQELRPLVPYWAEQAPECQFLVTSRIRLDLTGEVVQPLDALEPEVATQLFVERARHFAPNLEISESEEAVVRELVDRLDGLPLAIELAAGRATVLPPAELLKRLDRRFELIRSRRPELSPRQATLEGAIAWSWELLDDDQRSALAQCSVFVGGFDLDSVESVVEVDSSTIDCVERLQMNSLVRTESLVSRTERSRFYLYESVRRFAAEKLAEMSRVHETFGRLGDSMIQRGEVHLEGIDCRDSARHLAWLEDEFHNLEVLVVHEAVAPRVAIDAALILHPLLQRRGPFQKHADLLERALELADTTDGYRECDLLNCRAELHLARGEWPDANRLLEKSIQRSTEDSPTRIEALIARARCERLTGHFSTAIKTAELAFQTSDTLGLKRFQSMALGNLVLARTADAGAIQPRDFESLEEARRLASKAGDLRIEAFVSNTLGAFHTNVGNHEEARWAYAHVQELATVLGDRRLEGIATSNLALIDHMRGDVESAEELFGRALELARTLGNRREAAIMMGNLGAVLVDRGLWDEATEMLSRGLRITRELADHRATAVILGTLGAAHHARGNLDRADELYTQAEGLHTEHASESYLLQVVLFRAILALEEERIESARESLQKILDWPTAANAIWSGLAAVLLSSKTDGSEAIQGPLPIQIAARAARSMGSPEREEKLRELRDSHDQIPPVERWVGIRLIARILEKGPAPAPSSAPQLSVDSNFYWFELEQAERVDIRRRGPARLLLEAFIKSHRDDPGEALDLEELFKAGWPGEKISVGAANKRVYAAIGTLRRMGLSDVLLTVDEGYLLDPSLKIDIR